MACRTRRTTATRSCRLRGHRMQTPRPTLTSSRGNRRDVRVRGASVYPPLVFTPWLNSGMASLTKSTEFESPFHPLPHFTLKPRRAVWTCREGIVLSQPREWPGHCPRARPPCRAACQPWYRIGRASAPFGPQAPQLPPLRFHQTCRSRLRRRSQSCYVSD